MKRTATGARLGFFLFFFGFVGAVFSVSAPTALGQACTSKPLEQGRVCTKPGAKCSPPTIGAGDVGVCTIEGLRPEALACECQGAPIASYNVTLTPLTPSDLDTGTATSTITVLPFNGFTGTVNFTCSVSGMTDPAPSCVAPPPATVTSVASATSLLKVSVVSSTAQGTYKVTVSAADEHGRPPDNGAQSSIMSVTRLHWTIGNSLGATGIALLIFLAVLAIWGLSQARRSKRDASE